MFQRYFKQPFSLTSIIVIALFLMLVRFVFVKTDLSAFSNFLYLLIFLTGIGFTRRTLLFYFSDFTVGFCLLAIALGTNIFGLLLLEDKFQPLMQFTLLASIVFFTASWHSNQKLVSALFLSLALSLIILFQATGYLALLIPVLWGVHDKTSWRSKMNIVRNNSRQALISAGCLGILIAFPVLLLKISPGEIALFSFSLPGKFMSVPSWFWTDVFSFDHGWLIYTPLMAFAFIGFYYIAKENRPLYYAVFIFCSLDILIESCWTELGSTPIFGQIAFIPIYALLFFPMAGLLASILKRSTGIRVIFLCLLAIFIFLNIFQTWQFSRSVILKTGMTADKYSLAFGRVALTEEEKLKMSGIDCDASPILNDETRFRKIRLAYYDFDDPQAVFIGKLQREFVKSGKIGLVLDSSSRYSPGYHILIGDFIKGKLKGIRITAEVYATDEKALFETNLIITSVHEGKNYRIKRLNLGDLRLKTGKWNTVSLDYRMPADVYDADQLYSFVWYTGHKSVYIEDLKYEGFERKK